MSVYVDSIIFDFEILNYLNEDYRPPLALDGEEIEVKLHLGLNLNTDFFINNNINSLYNVYNNLTRSYAFTTHLKDTINLNNYNLTLDNTSLSYWNTIKNGNIYISGDSKIIAKKISNCIIDITNDGGDYNVIDAELDNCIVIYRGKGRGHKFTGETTNSVIYYDDYRLMYGSSSLILNNSVIYYLSILGNVKEDYSSWLRKDYRGEGLHINLKVTNKKNKEINLIQNSNVSESFIQKVYINVEYTNGYVIENTLFDSSFGGLRDSLINIVIKNNSKKEYNKVSFIVNDNTNVGVKYNDIDTNYTVNIVDDVKYLSNDYLNASYINNLLNTDIFTDTSDIKPSLHNINLNDLKQKDFFKPVYFLLDNFITQKPLSYIDRYLVFKKYSFDIPYDNKLLKIYLNLKNEFTTDYSNYKTLDFFIDNHLYYISLSEVDEKSSNLFNICIDGVLYTTHNNMDIIDLDDKI